MLEQFVILSKGGLVLFQSNKYASSKAISHLFGTILLEGGSEMSFSLDTLVVEWRLWNQHNLVIVVVYEKLLSKQLKYVPDLFRKILALLINKYDSILPSWNEAPPNADVFSDFAQHYDDVLKECIHSNSKSCKAFKEGMDTLFSSQKKKPRPNKVELANQKKAERLAKTRTKKTAESPSLASIDKSVQTIREVEAQCIDVQSMTFQDGAQASSSAPKKSLGILQYVVNLANTTLTIESLAPTMSLVQAHLVTKNVATEIADEICASVSQSLVGQVHSTFSSITTVVKKAMNETLTRILTPKRNVDIAAEINQSKEQNRPYTIVFVGVNGVGKSTSLAKVCAWLLKQQFKVMIAACDTFRSGAVEQLQVHSRALGGVPIFQSGYGKDAANVAQQAIAQAHVDAVDVVLIDTAGRMQDNEPLMASLAKLINLNKPDLILFVGEALVGNVSVDQLTKFNRAFEEYGDAHSFRTIDGIILTKFDTVDDKVGAAISLAHVTKQPIVFVGVGQTYGDLRQLNISSIVDILVNG